MYNTTCKKGKRCINPPDMLKVAIGKKPKKIFIFLLWFKDRMHFAFFLYYMWRCFVSQKIVMICYATNKLKLVKF